MSKQMELEGACKTIKSLVEAYYLTVSIHYLEGVQYELNELIRKHINGEFDGIRSHTLRNQARSDAGQCPVQLGLPLDYYGGTDPD